MPTCKKFGLIKSQNSLRTERVLAGKIVYAFEN